MTRLVGVRAVCDGCSAAAATVFCVSHRNVLCQPCDRAQHNTHSTASHQRVDLSFAVTALPFCEHCDDAPATTYCESESSTLCDKCDTIVHEVVETPHWRTSIQRTLHSRAVEFRESSRPRQAGRPRPSQVNDTSSSRQRAFTPEKCEKGKDPLNPKQQGPYPYPLPPTTSPTRQRPMSPSAIPSRPLSTPASSASTQRPSAMRARRSQAPQQRQAVTPTFSAAPSVPPRHNPTQQRRRLRPLNKRKRDMQRLSQPMPNSRPPDVPFSRTNILPTNDMFGYPPLTRTSQPIPYPLQADLCSQQQSQVQPLQEPLLMATDSRYLDLDELNYESLELSGEATAIEGLNGSGKSVSMSGSVAESGASSRRETPDTDMLPPAEGRIGCNTPNQAALREVMASAVAAAGEQYLLNNVSSGSGSSGERESPPVDMSCAPDPAGLVAAATAAAASAAAQAAAGVDVNNQVVKGTGGGLTSNTTSEGLDGRMRPTRVSRRMSEGGMTSARDEGMQRLETESRKTKEEVMNVDSGELVAQMSDGEEMGYLEISRDDFGGVFDAIDLTQFEQSGFSTVEFRPMLDSDEG